MRARLVALEGQADICLDRPLTLVGRHRGCDVRVNSPQVSRQHVCLAWQDGGIEVRDLGSTNGIKINGQRVESGRLRPGDELSIARYRFVLIVTGHPSSTIPCDEPDNPPPTPAGLGDAHAQGSARQCDADAVGSVHGGFGIDRLRKA